MLTPRSRYSGDDGAILVLALLFILVISVTTVAVVTQASVSLRNTDIVRNKTVKVYTADAGLELGVQRVRQDPTLCPNKAAGLMVIPGLDESALPSEAAPEPVTPDLTVKCETLEGSSLGANGFAFITTDTQSTDSYSNQGGSVPPKINGPVFAGNWQDGNPNPISTHVESGDAYRSPNGRACTGKPAGLVISPSPPYQYKCANPLGFSSPMAMANAVDHELPAYPTVNRSLMPASTAAGCSVFLPGRYTAPAPNSGVVAQSQRLQLTKDNYFASGVYYFENVRIEVDPTLLGGPNNSMKVVAGAPGPDDDILNRSGPVNNRIPTAGCRTDTMVRDSGLDPTIDPATTGVIWVLGGTSHIVVENGDAQLELFTPTNNGSGTQERSILAVPSGSGPYVESRADYTQSTPLFFLEAGSGPQAAVHGMIWAPDAQIEFNNVTGSQGARLGNGVVAGRLTLQNSSNANGFLLSVRTKPTQRLTRVVATAGGGAEGRTVTATAVVSIRNDSGVAEIHSWRSD